MYTGIYECFGLKISNTESNGLLESLLEATGQSVTLIPHIELTEDCDVPKAVANYFEFGFVILTGNQNN